MEVVAYQTLEDRDNRLDVELDGPYKCTRSDAWLGHGYYFWDTDIRWAKQWGKYSFIKKGKSYIIGQCNIVIDESCLDLVGVVAHRILLRECIQIMKTRGIFNHTSLTFANIIHFMKNNNLFEYKSIRTQESPPSSKDNVPFRIVTLKDGTINVKEVMDLNQRVQICVIEKKNVILQPFKVIYP